MSEGNVVSEEFGKEFWEERYGGHSAVHGKHPNPHLVAEAGDLVPGKALDAGCGEGAEARWLASHGWQVTAVDIAANALDRARDQAKDLGAGVASRIDWIQADLTSWKPPEDHFDLVCAHYVHPAGSRQDLFRRLAASVVPGGMLLIVDHHPASSGPEVHITATEIAAGLDPDRWDITVAESRTRPATDHHGHKTTLHDAVLRARKRP